MEEKDLVAEKIKALVVNAEQMKANEFREALDTLAVEAEERELSQLIESFDQHPLRIVVNFKNRGLTAILKEQFQEVTSGILLVIDDFPLKQANILFCDPEILRDLALQTRMLPDKIYLFLEQSAGFSEFKSYNTRNFIQPFEFYRIVKEILQRLYL